MLIHAIRHTQQTPVCDRPQGLQREASLELQYDLFLSVCPEKPGEMNGELERGVPFEWLADA